jgi:hypothetical protein
MQKQRPRRSAQRLAVLAGTVASLFVGSQLSAQAPGSGGVLSLPGVGASQDERLPRLLSSPSGGVFRLWQREPVDLQVGGGAVFLAVSIGQDAWKTVLEIHPPEKGDTARTGDLAFGADGQVAVAYQWWRDNPRTKQVRLARSSDGGKTWTAPATQLDASGKAFDPHIGWGRGKDLVVVWSDERRGRRLFDIYARRSVDGGVTWEPEQLLSRFPKMLANDLHARPELLSDGQGRFWAIWVGLRAERSAFYLNRSEDGGKTWTEPVPLTGNSESVFAQQFLRAGDRLLLTWQDRQGSFDRIFAVASSDAGMNWSSPVRVDHLSSDAKFHAASSTAVLSPSGEALVAWQDPRNGRQDIFIARSTDGGRSWGSEDQRMDLDEPGTAISGFPKLVRNADGRIALGWDDDRSGLEVIYVRVRSGGPKPEWGPELLVSTPPARRAIRMPELLWGSGGQLYVAWELWDHTLSPALITKQVGGLTIRPN